MHVIVVVVELVYKWAWSSSTVFLFLDAYTWMAWILVSWIRGLYRFSLKIYDDIHLRKSIIMGSIVWCFSILLNILDEKWV